MRLLLNSEIRIDIGGIASALESLAIGGVGVNLGPRHTVATVGAIASPDNLEITRILKRVVPRKMLPKPADTRNTSISAKALDYVHIGETLGTMTTIDIGDTVERLET